MKKKSGKTYLDKQIMVFEYGFAKWMLEELERNGQMDSLKEHFPEHWKFIVFMVYCRIAYKSPLNKKQMLIHWYSINDSIEHFKTVKKIKFAPGESVTSEINKSTKELLKKMKISIT